MKAFNAYIFIEFYLYECIDALKLAALYMRSFTGIDIDRTAMKHLEFIIRFRD